MLTDGLVGARIFVRPGPTDMRKAINGLVVLVEEVLESDPFSQAVFLFCNRDRRIRNRPLSPTWRRVGQRRGRRLGHERSML